MQLLQFLRSDSWHFQSIKSFFLFTYLEIFFLSNIWKWTLKWLNAWCAGSINSRVGHALANWYNTSPRVGRTSGGRQRRRLWYTVHRVGVRWPHYQGLVYIHVRVCTDTQWTQTWHCVSTVSRQTGRFWQLWQHNSVSSHCSVLLESTFTHFIALLS